ncbi:putative transcription factor GRF family [Helianthus annuus]|nr:putative transcription factor GRF family [Helianthus annuus]KAJ0507818.1 putative transcription factor GRF family [Helianthus annuus]KAJ0873815.1 putative transcription factor GRF family [Helianthus annuus]
MVLCECGKEAVIVTFWTNRNPGRRFYACPDQGSDCRFIGWVDTRCQRCVDIIPGLLRGKNHAEEQKNKLEVRVKESEEEVMKLKKWLIISWICFICYIVYF